MKRQAGFTLTELMVVVAIIGVLVTMAIVYMRPRVRPIDVAMRLGDLVHEANRRAVALGPVRSDVVVALGFKARTQIRAAKVDTVVTFTLFRLEETEPGVPPFANWMELTSYTVDANVEAFEWVGAVGTYALPDKLDDWDAFQQNCRPDGTCDPTTVFFRTAGEPVPDCPTGGQLLVEHCARMSIMPLGGAITTSTDWN